MGVATKFATAERSGREEIDLQRRQVEALENLDRLVQGVPYISLILNSRRQAVFFNKALMEAFDIHSPEKIFGKRPGEIVDCIHADKEPGGCGTSEHCSVCGAVDAVLRSQQERATVSEECCIATLKDGELTPLDLQVTVSPFDIQGEWFSMVTLADISDSKRRRAMERIFFHDVINLAGGLKGYFDLLATDIDMEQLTAILPALQGSLDQMLGELMAQRSLAQAESGDLPVNKRELRSLEVLEAVAAAYRESELTRACFLEVDRASADVTLRTDNVLLRRALGNLVKNALEASASGDTVRIGCRSSGDDAHFWVHNRQVMPRQVQLRVFQRSFSTKGQSRGLGTYSVRLLAERYLKGQASFESTRQTGTTFWISLPRNTWSQASEPTLADTPRAKLLQLMD